MKPLLIFCSLFALCSFSLVSANGPANRPPSVQLLVKPRAQMSEAALHALLSARGGEQVSTIAALNVRVIQVPERAAEALLEALRKNADVEYAERDGQAQALGTANDPYFTNGSQWWLSKIQAPSAWDTSLGSSSVVVAVLDSGVLSSHPDLSGKVLPGYDFINQDQDAADDNGHGTAVAGIIASSSNNSLGMASVAWHNPILPVKVLDASGSGSYSAICNGITWSADSGARIINLSLGGTSSSRALQDAVNYAWNKKAVVIAAAGNNGNNTPFYPAACNNVLAVSATNSTDGRPSWSNFGSYVDISAPGESVLTLYGSNSYAWWNGTSFSCPVTAGVVALMASANPQLSNQVLVDLVCKNSDDIGAAGYDVYYGHGRVNAFKAIRAAVGATTVDTTAPSVSILSPANGATVSGTVNISASATDNVAVTRLELYINGTLFAQSASASASFSWNTVNELDGSYLLEARAYDGANNVGSRSITVNVANSVAADLIAPTVAITSPLNGAKVSSKSVKISVQSSDNVAVTKLELFIDGKLFGSSTASSATFTWNTSKVSSGNHTLQAYAYDAAGNIGASGVTNVTR
jgi:thermitase